MSASNVTAGLVRTRSEGPQSAYSVEKLAKLDFENFRQKHALVNTQ